MEYLFVICHNILYMHCNACIYKDYTCHAFVPVAKYRTVSRIYEIVFAYALIVDAFLGTRHVRGFRPPCQPERQCVTKKFIIGLANSDMSMVQLLIKNSLKII